jgi:heterotetrameric sarcosine oxidase alpha subunit
MRLKAGGRIDRSRVLEFKWDGHDFAGHPGDTLASALMANNQRIIGRSFKYHRPRGIMSAGVEESGAIVTIGTGELKDPNVRATMQELYSGLEAHGQNAWPNVRFDLGSISDLFSNFFAAGFYYKTFMGLPPFEWGRGTGYWMQYEKLIRKAAGMGEASHLPDPDSYDHVHTFCDVLVVGSGPAGLSAARVAADAGLDVLLVEQDFELGGDYLNQTKGQLDDLKDTNVRIMTRTTAFGLYDHGVAGLLERVTDHLANSEMYQPRQRFWTVRTKQIILATGALERQIAFGNNDRPGIMTTSAARSYLNRFGVLPGQNIIVATCNDSAYETAFELAQAGAKVRILEARTATSVSYAALADEYGISIETDTTPLNAKGKNSIRSLEVLHGHGSATQSNGTRQCDLLTVSGGWSPVVNLQSHRGSVPIWNDENACFLPGTTPEQVHMAGSASGLWQMEDCHQSGKAAGAKAARSMGKTVPEYKSLPYGGWANAIKPIYEVTIPDRHLKSFVDFQHDVTSDDVRLAVREGFVSVEHLKRYTTLGMATDQGKMGNVIGLALMAEALGKNIPQVGTTRFRPPYTSISLGALAGRNQGEHFRPTRRTPMHDWNLNQGCTMTDVGLWRRPWYMSRNSETIKEAYVREAETVRRLVGLCDVTSLGKIAIQGPDATEFLNRIYTNPFSKLPIGKARYGIMLRDDGLVMDDGTTWRLSETEYFMTTTTANAAKVMVWLEELLQLRWPDLRVHVTSVSDQWAACSVAGPKSRQVLGVSLADALIISNENLPFMGVIETYLKNGVPCRIARISFSGEMAYEVYVPSDYGPAMMDLLWPATKQLDGCLYGLEALGTLRIEKGHVTGSELDGRVTIEDAGLGKMASGKKDYIGNVLRKRPALQDQSRPQLVGIFPKERTETFNGGSILCHPKNIEGHGEGWITGVTYSPELGHWIGIGFISGGYKNWAGRFAVAADPIRNGNTIVEIVSPHMVDPKGERMHG